MPRTFRPWTLLLGLLPLAALPLPAAADLLYTIDVTSDVLVVLDTQTGTRMPVDPNPLAGFFRSRHTMHGGLLYVVNSPAGCSDDDSPPFMNTIDPLVPSAAGLVPMTTGGGSVPYARVGDLASNGTTLLVSLAPAGPPACNNESILADLSPGADMTNLTDFSAFGADMDGLAATSGGSIYALDARPESQADLYRVGRPSTYQLIGTHAMTNLASYAGMAFSASGQLWALERGPSPAAGTLRRIDPVNGQVLASVPIVPDAAGLSGLSTGPAPTLSRRSSWGRLKTIYR